MPTTPQYSLGAFLKDRRARLDPANSGFSSQRRRTPGLRREEVALKASVSTTWYTWLEQGRGGAPSAAVLERLAHALELNDAEREHVFLLALGHPPGPRYHVADDVSPRLQRVLDALTCPAIIRTATWDVVAWNRAAALVLTDYGQLDASQRNILRLMFCAPHIRQAQADWESVARYVVETFRADVIRADASHQVQALVDELCERSTVFQAMWDDTGVQTCGGGTKHLHHPDVGTLNLEFSSFAVDARPDLSLMVFNPVTAADAKRIQTMMAARD